MCCDRAHYIEGANSFWTVHCGRRVAGLGLASCRVDSMTMLVPTVEEQPALVEGLLQDLIASGATTPSAVERARRAAELYHARADKVLTKLGLVKEDEIARAWSRLRGPPARDGPVTPGNNARVRSS